MVSPLVGLGRKSSGSFAWGGRDRECMACVWTEQAAAASREVRARSRNGGRNIDSELELQGEESG